MIDCPACGNDIFELISADAVTDTDVVMCVDCLAVYEVSHAE
jgi:hypothetical protein